MVLRINEKNTILNKGINVFYGKKARILENFKVNNIYGVHMDAFINKYVSNSEFTCFNFDQTIHNKSNPVLTQGKCFKFESSEYNQSFSYVFAEPDYYLNVLLSNFKLDVDIIISNHFEAELSMFAKICFFERLKKYAILGKTILIITEDLFLLNILGINDFNLISKKSEEFEIKNCFKMVQASEKEFLQIYQKITKSRINELNRQSRAKKKVS